MTSRQRAERDLEIFEARKREQPWEEVAQAHGVSMRHARRIVASFEDGQSPLERDPLDVVEDLYSRLEETYDELVEVAMEATNDSARVGAIRVRLDVARSQAELLQAVGVLPRNLAKLKPEIDVRRMTQALDALFDRHELPPEFEADFLEVLQRRLPGQGRDGKSVPE